MNVKFEVNCELHYSVHGQSEFIFNVQAAQGRQQQVIEESLRVDGAKHYAQHVETDPGNRFIRVSAPAGDLLLHYMALIHVDYVCTQPVALEEVPVAQLPAEVLQYVLPSRYCQSDRLIEFAVREFGSMALGFTRVQSVVDWVNRHVKFAPGTTNVNTCALEVLIQRRGVCRDFAHLTIALLRALNIPTRFVTGYDYGVPASYGPTDFHAYVEAFLGDRWYIFDATQLCPRNGLVRIGTGRDAADVAFATIFGPVHMRHMNLSIEPRFSLDAPQEIVDSREYALSSACLETNGPSRH